MIGPDGHSMENRTDVSSVLILVVEDEQDLNEILNYNLQRAGFDTRSALTGAEALQILETEPLPDLVILDLMLPDIAGIELCRRMRNSSRMKVVPVLMLTAKGDETDRIAGFEAGADDYVVKPFSVKELLLRVKAILKRTRERVTTDSDDSHGAVFSIGPLRLNSAAHRVWIGGREVQLTPLEFRLLAVLMRRRGRVQSRERLLADVWQSDPDLSTRTVDTHIKRLREKLGPAGDWVETVRGIGYRLENRS
jgi:two-component system phosphate regulon response regulator PhoB